MKNMGGDGRGVKGGLELFGPLERFYAKSGISLPPIEWMDGGDIPEPEHGLLVHGGDMTSRLRRHHGSEIGLRVCSVSEDGDFLSRLVVLYRVDTGSPVEFGAIRIGLSELPEEARARVVEAREPLGAVLEDCGCEYSSSPGAFFRFGADAFVGVLLEEEIRKPLYGRCNVLSNAEGEGFAEIVEILPGTGGN